MLEEVVAHHVFEVWGVGFLGDEGSLVRVSFPTSSWFNTIGLRCALLRFHGVVLQRRGYITRRRRRRSKKMMNMNTTGFRCPTDLLGGRVRLNFLHRRPADTTTDYSVRGTPVPPVLRTRTPPAMHPASRNFWHGFCVSGVGDQQERHGRLPPTRLSPRLFVCSFLPVGATGS